MKTWPTVTMAVSDLASSLADYNPRVISRAAQERLRASLQTFGIAGGIVFNVRTSRVVGGHQRIRLLAEAAVDRVDVTQVDLSEEEERALNVSLNRQDFGQFDREKLDEVLRDLSQDGADLLESLHLDELPEYRASDADRLLERILEEREYQPQDSDPDPEELAQGLADRVRTLPRAALRGAFLVAVPLQGRGDLLVLADPDHRDFVSEIERAHAAGDPSPLARLFDALV